MRNKIQSPPHKQRDFLSMLMNSGFAAFCLILLFSVSSVQAATPAVGSVISNQASADYTDGSGTVRTALSNEVRTTVTQVASLTLTTDVTKTVSPGGTAYMPHTLTNTGNGSDTFTLSLLDNVDDFTFGTLAIYLDADGNGVPDSATALCTGAACSSFTTPSLAAGGTYKFVVALQVPISATNGLADTAVITATSTFDNTKTQFNTDTVNVTTGPAFNVTKSINVPSGASSSSTCTGTDYLGSGCVKTTYTLTYTNTGAAGNLYLKDIIGSLATVGMEYIPGSALWSNSGTALTDVASGDPSGIDFQAIDSSGVSTIQAVVANVGSGVSGTVTFSVGIKSTAVLGSSTTTNTAAYAVVPGSIVPALPPTTTNTNPSSYTVAQTYSVVANDWSTDATDGDNVAKDDTTNPRDVVLVASAGPGATVTFDNYIWNTGTGSDIFDITLSTGNFPVGTVFELLKSDGATSLSNSGGNGAADTGPLAAGESYKVVVRATIPASACTPTCPTGPFTVDLTATSVGDVTKTNKVFDQLTALVVSTVDMTNTLAGTASDLGSANATATTTNAIAAGATTSFDLFIKNAGTSDDDYTLQYSSSNFVASSMPSGWVVNFRTTSDNTTAGTCSAASGTVISTPVTVTANGGQVKVCAIVTAPSNATAGTTDIYFKALGTSASDVKHDAVTITNAALTLTPNGVGQIYPGGSMTYSHDLTNTGNVSCGGDFAFNVSGVTTGWSVGVYDDANSNGAADSGETLLVSHNGTAMTAGTNLTGSLAVAASRKLVVKIISPAGAASGDSDNIIVSVVDNGASACTATPANDLTTVITGQLRLDKLQANDVACDGTADGAFVLTALTAKPGECLVYQVTGTNEGTTNVTAVSVNDTTPSFTSYQSGFTCSAGTKAPLSPVAGYVGSLSCGSIATMIPGDTATMTFVVKINP